MFLELNCSKRVIVFTSENIEHDDNPVEERSSDYGLSMQMKKDIDAILELGLSKPGQVLSQFR